MIRPFITSFHVAALVAATLASVFPTSTQAAEPVAGPLTLGPKIVNLHKVRALVGPAVFVDGKGIAHLAWVEEDKEIRTLFYARTDEAGGKLGQPVRVNRSDEVPYFRQEAPALTVNGDTVLITWALIHPNATADKLAAIVGQTVDGIGAIKAATQQLASGSSDLSSRTEEQVASLEEMAAAIRQLSVTIRQNAENAQQANQLASDARSAAERGGTVATGASTITDCTALSNGGTGISHAPPSV